jgi:hypothetical protein
MQYEFPSSRHSHVGYPYRVWIYSIITACLLEVPFGIADAGEFVIIFFLMSMPLVLPALVIYMLFFWRLINSRLSGMQIKILLGLIGIVLLYGESLLIEWIFLHDVFVPAVVDSSFLSFSAIFLGFSIALSLKKR